MPMFGSVVAALVVSVVPASAACELSYGVKTPDAFVAYVDHPERLLSGYPNGGDGLSNLVVSFVARERTGLRTTLASLSQATPKQREAIGVGLGRAMESCRSTDSDLSRDIRKTIDRTSDPSVKKGYQTVMMKMDAPTVVLPSAKKQGASSFAELPLTGPLTSGGAASLPGDPLAPGR